jgi:multicomponent Na+:H+ antiporter subunit G
MAEIFISLVILLGSFFILIASIGMVRFRDLYGRLHASTKATSFGILLLLIGASVYFNEPEVYVKTFLIILFIYLTAPLAAHSIINSFRAKSEVPDSSGSLCEIETSPETESKSSSEVSAETTSSSETSGLPPETK